jgi:multidrug resistance efflux pump
LILPKPAGWAVYICYTETATELELGAQASQLTVQKAEKAYGEARDNYARLEQLFQAGALAQADLAQARLDLAICRANNPSVRT